MNSEGRDTFRHGLINQLLQRLQLTRSARHRSPTGQHTTVRQAVRHELASAFPAKGSCSQEAMALTRAPDMR